MGWNELEFSQLNNHFYFLVPVIIVIILIMSYRKRELIITQLRFNLEYKFKITKTVLISLGLILIVFSLLGPQLLKGYQNIEKKGLDIYILLDTSKSMLAEDIKPNRLERAKKSVEQLIDSLQGDRIGFIPFASDSYVQMPLTDDYHLAKMFLDVIDTNMVAGGGTNLASAIKLASESFERSSQGDKVIIIFSDGEEHNAQGIKAAKEVQNTKIYTLGVGTKKGGLVPKYNAQGRRVGYRKKQTGDYVVSKLNQSTLEKISQIGSGTYRLLNLNNNASNKLSKDLSQLQKSEIAKDKVKKFSQIYQYFLASGLLLFLVGYLLPERRQ